MKFLYQRFATLLLSLTLASIVASGSAQVPYILVHSLSDPATNALPYAKHGASVAVDGSFAVVGAPSPSDTEPSHPSPGRVKVYDTASGVLLHTLMAPKPAVADLIGSSVAVSGNLVVVGASRDDSGATDAGSAYVFDLAGTTPTVPLLILTNPMPAVNDRFGGPVAISGTRVLVGSVWEDNGGQDTGSVYVYDVGSARPTVPVMVLTNPVPAANERFGSPLAISGSRTVIGVRFTNTLSSSVGGAYVYDLGSTAPTTPMFTLTNPTPAAGDNFGISVAISGNLVVVGASNDDTGADDAGSAYVYDLASSTPTVPAVTLTNPSPVAGELFGISVAVAGTRVVVGSPLDGTGSYRAGSVYVYELASVTPTVPMAILFHPEPSPRDLFGGAVAIAGKWIVVGAAWDDVSPTGIDSGSAFVFSHGPVLRTAPTGPGRASLSWAPTNLPRLVLQYTDSFAPTNWITASSGATNPVVIMTTNASRFYRLIQQ